ncbi:MAG: hypothetical protein GXP39_03995 [Chloroflexi bacterium]|nr:hypothetical protein [Chloroflexota bacterium]
MSANRVYTLVATVIVALLLIAYLAVVAWAGYLSLTMSEKPSVPAAVTNLFTGVAGLIAAHFAAVYGLSQAGPANVRAQLRSVRTWVRGPAEMQGGGDELRQWISVIAVVVYLISVLLAWLFWFVDGLSENTADLVKNLATTGVGAFLGVLAFMLRLPSR